MATSIVKAEEYLFSHPDSIDTMSISIIMITCKLKGLLARYMEKGCKSILDYAALNCVGVQSFQTIIMLEDQEL